jgi:superfamily II DNA/RNA helicase
MRIMLFKRFESSVFAFRETIRRILTVHERFLAALKEGIVPAGEDAQEILYEPSAAEEQDLVEALRQVTGRYKAEDFDLDRLIEHIKQDIRILKKIQDLVAPITPKQDTKLQTLKERLARAPLDKGKCLIFTEYADTAQYLFANLNPKGKRDDVDVIYSSGKDKSRVVGRFAPKANPEYEFAQGESELNLVIATDVLSEGLNLQDCDKIINYDLHWNPVRLIQRFGRIDRIGTEYDKVFGFNFLPELGIEKQLGLHEKLKRRIQEIMETIGEDSAILDPTEQVNEEALYAIYEKKGVQLSLFEEEEDRLLDLNEAEEIMRRLRAENPAEFERIAHLRDGIRTGKASTQRGTYVFCQADRYQKLYLLDREGNVFSSDIPQILGTIRCNVEEPANELPKDHNGTVTRTHHQFAEEVKQRQTERKHTASLNLAQRYVLRELRVLYGEADSEDAKEQINILEEAFRGPLTSAVNREINRMKRNGMTGKVLLKGLGETYTQHNMREWSRDAASRQSGATIPRIVCSEALV